MKNVLLLLFTAFICFTAYKAFELRSMQLVQQELKEDYAEINRVNYGLFNLQLWKEKAIQVFEKRIKDFQISPEVFDDLEGELVAYLNTAYTTYIENGALFDEIFAEVERKGSVNKIFLKLLKDNLAPQIKNLNLRSRIPALAKELSKELKRNEPQIKGYLEQELGRLLVDASPADIVDRRVPIYQKYNSTTLNETSTVIRERILTNEEALQSKIKLLYSLLLGAFLLAVALYKILEFKYFITITTAVSIVFLLLGVSLPMIDIDARLNAFEMGIMGTKISFEEQILFFQSKSILDVTWTLLEGRGIDLKIVGILILMFSIVVPFLKLVLGTMYIYIDNVRQSKLVENIVFYLGKWSMADVFVVAMFMAYIGFQGLVTAQLGQIGRNQTGFAVETLNYSQLSPGALFFTTYCLLSILTGLLIARKYRQPLSKVD